MVCTFVTSQRYLAEVSLTRSSQGLSSLPSFPLSVQFACGFVCYQLALDPISFPCSWSVADTSTVWSRCLSYMLGSWNVAMALHSSFWKVWYSCKRSGLDDFRIFQTPRHQARIFVISNQRTSQLYNKHVPFHPAPVQHGTNGRWLGTEASDSSKNEARNIDFSDRKLSLRKLFGGR